MNIHNIRVLYSFPHKIGASRICDTAWEQVNGLATAGADVLCFPGVLYRTLPENVKVYPTLSWGKLRISYKLLGSMRALALHDYIVSRRIEELAGEIDIIHAWPLGALRTLKTAARFGIPTVLQRPNTHTRFGYEIVRNECDKLGISLPPGDEHAYNENILRKEEEEYRLAYRILCPSEFVIRSFLDRGFAKEKLVRNIFGFDEKIFYPDITPRDIATGLTVLFVGVCNVVKGLHCALEAWLQSPAHRDGTFLIAGKFLPEYYKKLSPLLSHPSIRMLGHREDVPDLMRKSDVLILPSITEGFGRVCTEALGSGCVPLVSDACTELCRNMENALVHHVGDIKTLSQHITMLHENPSLLNKLRTASLRTAPEMTWSAACVELLQVYREIISSKS